MPLYLAVDAGGTTTDCLLAEGDTVLARHSAGSIKLIRAGEAQARINLRALLAGIAEASGADLRAVSQTCIGLAGIGMPEFAAWVRDSFAALVGGRVLLLGDEEIALDAAFHGGPGILVLAGTGSNVVARARDGAMHRVGGWGPAIGDEGSGNWIGAQALRAAFRAHDAGERTLLLDRILHFWKLAGLEDLVAEANRVPGPDLAALTPVVNACADAGDAVATRVLVSAGQELAIAAMLAIRRLREHEPEVPLPPVALTGSVLRRVAMVREAMTDYLTAHVPGVEVLREPVDPLLGALWRAQQGA